MKSTNKPVQHSPVPNGITTRAMAAKQPTAEGSEMANAAPTQGHQTSDNDIVRQMTAMFNKLQSSFEQGLANQLGRMQAQIDEMRTVQSAAQVTSPNTSSGYGSEQMTQQLSRGRSEEPQPTYNQRSMGHRDPTVNSMLQDISYSGRKDRTNPIRFLNKFEEVMEYEQVPEGEKRFYFARCLRGAAKNWYELHDFQSYRQARTGFKHFFWGQEDQARFRETMLTGQYEDNQNETLCEYFLRHAREAQMLEPPMNEHEIIRSLKRHFTEDIARELRPGSTRTLAEAAEILEEIQNQMDFFDRRKKSNQRNYGKQWTYYNPPNKYQEYYKHKDVDQAAEVPKNQTSRPQQATDQKPVDPSPQKQDVGAKTQQGPATRTRALTRKQQISAILTDDEDNTHNEGKSWEDTLDPTATTQARAENGNHVKIEQHNGDREAPTGTPTGQQRPAANDRNAAAPTLQFDDVTTSAGQQTCSTQEETYEFDDMEYEDISIEEIVGDYTDEDEVSTVNNEAEVQSSEMAVIKNEIYNPSCKAYLKTRVNGIQTTVLIDTGAGISVISETLFETIRTGHPRIKTLPTRKIKLYGAFDEKSTDVNNMAEVEIELGDRSITEYCYIVKRVSFPVILGVSFLSTHKVCLDFSGPQMVLRIPIKNEQVRVNISSYTNEITWEQAEEDIEHLKKRYIKLFDNKLGKIKGIECEIKMKTNTPFKCKSYPIPLKFYDEVKKQIAQYEELGIIEKRNTEYINPLVVVAKDGGKSIRICLDARELNSRMHHDYAQPPTIEEVISRIQNKVVFSKIDITKAFWQVELEEESRQYTGFIFDGLTYVFNRMPFSLKISGGVFTRVMNTILPKHLGKQMLVYLDDILIASNSLVEHKNAVGEVLAALHKNGARVNREKTQFLRNEISFLGHTFTQWKIEINKSTRESIESFNRPTTKRKLQAFLGLVNWDRRCIPNLSQLTEPLGRVLQKGCKFKWEPSQEESFQKIEQAFGNPQELFLIKQNEVFIVDSDASNKGAGARLAQRVGEEEFTIAYVSRKLNDSEKNFTTTEEEALAIVYALQKWRILLLGRPIIVRTDRNALRCLQACICSSERIARWLNFIQEFDIELEHNEGARDN